MKKTFLDEDFLLQNQTAVMLYQEVKELPIIDYHCHVSPKEIAENRTFENMTQIWLGGDHYKWRMIRACGVPEDEITGNAHDFVKFRRFAESLPKAIGNPMVPWTYLELKKYFSYTGTLNAQTAQSVWNSCNKLLPSMPVKEIISSSNVEVIVTTDDPIDSLQYHAEIAADASFGTKVFPAWRPDKVMQADKPDYSSYIGKLSDVSGIEINNISDLKAALVLRMDFFAAQGCPASDHGMGRVPFDPNATEEQADTIFKKAISSKIDGNELETFQTVLNRFLAAEYSKRGWIFQIHYGALRNTNTDAFKRIGADAGFDTIGGYSTGMEKLASFLDNLNSSSNLPKTIIYSLDPNDNAQLDALVGCYSGEGIAGKVQHGAAWWFSDTKSGMEAHLASLASISVLGNFLGMLTDSRSFLSYTRHEYFRRILCNMVGTWVENGELPGTFSDWATIVKDISYFNCKKFFSF